MIIVARGQGQRAGRGDPADLKGSGAGMGLFDGFGVHLALGVLGERPVDGSTDSPPARRRGTGGGHVVGDDLAVGHRPCPCGPLLPHRAALGPGQTWAEVGINERTSTRMTYQDRHTAPDRVISEKAQPDDAGRSAGQEQDGAAEKSLRVRSWGGAEFVVRLLRAERPDAPVELVIPAMGARARFYAPFSRGLHQGGLHVAVTDLRGQGESTPMARRGVAYGYREMVHDDLPAVVRAVSAAFPRSPVVLIGHSLGGQLALLSTATGLAGVHAVVLTAAGSVWWRGFGSAHGLRNLIFSQLFAALATVLGYWPGERFGFGGTQPTAVMRDWARQGRTGRYTLQGSDTDYEAALARLTLPVLAVGVENDSLALSGATDHLLRKIPAAPVSRWHYSEALAGSHRLDHFRWVRHSDGMSAYIADWISHTLTTRQDGASQQGTQPDPAGEGRSDRGGD
ncbi:alpha/beta fold hydrolase [Streptomyces sp. NPDC056568]|uniref:alpha/beta hydrolase family protein n=1 Tax=Streptomyces sp. NPDC056568 TaxID=3345866 RepID=UPI0036A92A64